MPANASLPSLARKLAPHIVLLLLTFGSAQASAQHAAEPDIQVHVEKKGESFIVDASSQLPVSVTTAWEVLTDFDHMTSIMSNLSASRIISRNGNTLTVLQQGKAHYGLFNYEFESVREIALEPQQRIVSRQLSGKARHFASVAQIQASEGGTELRYHAEIVPEGRLARLFGAPFVQHEIDEQLTLMAVEMLRREGKSPTAKNKDEAK